MTDRSTDLQGPPLGRATSILILVVAGVFALGLWDRTASSHDREVASIRATAR